MSNTWLRLWHDMPTDPKFRVIAKRAGRPLSEVVSVFVLMLTNASANASERGELDNWADEDAGAALDIDAAHVAAIREAMIGKTLDGNKLTGWEKRQPKREDGSAERAKEWRERKRTQANAKIREEERRKESETDSEQKQIQPSCADETPPEQPAGWQDLKLALNGSTEAMIADVQRFMGPIARRGDAVNWLTGTVSAFGSSRTAQAWTIVTAKLAKGEIVPNPLPLWSRTAKGLKDADAAPAATATPAFKSFRQQDAEGARALLERHRAKSATKDLAQ